MSSSQSNGAPPYDPDRIEDIIAALAFLRLESDRAGNTAMALLIDACFDMCRACHAIALGAMLTEARGPM
jgi:chorismate mutase